MANPTVSPVPEGQIIMPYLIVRGAAEALSFYAKAFGAEEHYRLQDGARIGHAEASIGRARFAVADEYPEFECLGPATVGGTSVFVSLYVPDVDALVARATAAGAALVRPITDEFHGDRVAQVKDPFGHRWIFSTRFEVVTPEEMQRRMSSG